jgi:hypothetical protein
VAAQRAQHCGEEEVVAVAGAGESARYSAPGADSGAHANFDGSAGVREADKEPAAESVPGSFRILQRSSLNRNLARRVIRVLIRSYDVRSLRRPSGAKAPSIFDLYAALKRRSSTVVHALAVIHNRSAGRATLAVRSNLRSRSLLPAQLPPTGSRLRTRSARDSEVVALSGRTRGRVWPCAGFLQLASSRPASSRLA